MTALLALLTATVSPTSVVAAANAPAPAPARPVADPQRAAEAPQDDEIVVTGQRTEGTDAYTLDKQTTATRLDITQRETPQSVSVVTRAQIEDFQLNDVNQLLSTVTGVNVQANETDRVYFSARGFDIQTFQIDGIGVPFAFGIQTGSIDTAIYDHIEVVRGAPGLLSSTGNPSAVINFIRKRPTRDLQASASAQYGSFDALRLDADVSVPLTRDGGVRARAVGVYSDADSYLDRYSLRRWTGYGIVEADLGASTVVSAGYGHQDHQSRAAQWGAIPLLYTDGTRIPFRRSDNTGPDWAGWNVIDRQIFGDATHRFGNGWVARLSAIRRATSEDDQLFYVYGAPDRATGLGILTYPGAFKGETRNLTVEGYVTGPVALFGREHQLNFGVNRSAQSYKQFSSYDYSTVNQSIPLARLFDGSFPRPNFPTTYDESLDRHTTRETAYAMARLNLADPLKLILGINVTQAKSDGISYGTPVRFDNTRALPYVGATFDLAPAISAYASYTTIFNPQVEIDANDRILSPIRGNNLEGGVKGEWFGGALNAAVAVFRTRQDNTAEYAGFGASPSNPSVLRSFYRGIDAKSEGVEVDVGGRLAPGLNLTGGYTLMRIEGEDGEAVRRYVPRSTGRLNVVYSPPSLAALKLGAAVQYQSRIFTPGQTVKQGAYALLDLLARYELTDRISLSANLRNVTNARYLTALTFDQSYYGAPRTVLGTIGVRY